MKFKSPLSQRIVISFVLLAAAVSGLFGTGIILSVHFVEENLVTTELQHEFQAVMEGIRQNRNYDLTPGTELFVVGQELPGFLNTVPPGFSEAVHEGRAYYVYAVEESGRLYYLVRDQTAFEQRELVLVVIVICGFVFSILVAFVLGKLLTKKVILPVRRLTSQVRDREKLIGDIPPLASDYADDEIGILANAFDETIDKLQNALLRETYFTGDVSHELRTPLMVIKSSCDLLTAKNSLDEYSRLRLAMIEKATGEIQELVETFLVLARGNTDSLAMATLAEVVSAEKTAWMTLAREKGCKFDILKDSECHSGISSKYPAVLLRAVLNNLVRNAFQHAGQGRIALRVMAHGFELTDTGPGISADEMELVFKKPHPRPGITRVEGFGIGLSLVQRICERQRWGFSLVQNRPAGCCFSVTLEQN